MGMASLLRSHARHFVVVQRDTDVLRLHIKVERIVTAVAADSRRFHPAKRRRQMAYVFGIHPHHSGVYPLCETVGPADATRPDVSGEPVANMVGDPPRLGM